jgi:hypothetical protein
VAAVITDIDIWRAARLLIEQHNDGRKIEAAGLADLMLGGRHRRLQPAGRAAATNTGAAR